MTIEIKKTRSSRQHTHQPNGSDDANEHCPWCGHTITHAELEEIRSRIQVEGNALIAKAEQILKDVVEAKRRARVCEVAARKEPSKMGAAVDPARLTPETEQSERRVEWPLPAPASDSPSVVLALIERLALNPGADAGKLDCAIAMYERLKAKEAELAFNSAKGRILKKLAHLKIVKNRSVRHEFEKGEPQNGTYEVFKYAPLEEIDKHLRPLLAGEDLDLSYSDESREGGGILIRGRLKHLPSGHYEDSLMPAPPDTTGGKSDVQAVGSTNSFLRRYVACNIFNIVVVGDDDDGNGGKIDERQTQTILDLIKRAKVGPKFLKYMKAKTVEEAGSLEAAVATIAARDYRKAISTLEEQVAKSEAGRAHFS